jgi:hypothetical protein
MAKPEDGIATQIRNIEHTYGKPIGAWIDRLESTQGFNALFTHRVRIHCATDIDADLLSWLHHAYQEAG